MEVRCMSEQGWLVIMIKLQSLFYSYGNSLPYEVKKDLLARS